jgi:hypothetical protein
MVGEMAIFRQLLGALFAMVAIAQMTGCPFRFNVVVSSPSCNRVRGLNQEVPRALNSLVELTPS